MKLKENFKIRLYSFIKKVRLDEVKELKGICSQEILSVEKVIYFC